MADHQAHLADALGYSSPELSLRLVLAFLHDRYPGVEDGTLSPEDELRLKREADFLVDQLAELSLRREGAAK